MIECVKVNKMYKSVNIKKTKISHHQSHNTRQNLLIDSNPIEDL